MKFLIFNRTYSANILKIALIKKRRDILEWLLENCSLPINIELAFDNS
jgi:hypothetical protein